MPRSSAVAGRPASEQRLGMVTAKGLKFFSAAESGGRGDDGGVSTQGGDDLVGERELVRVSSGHWQRLGCVHTLAQALAPASNTPGLAPAKGGSLAGLAKVAQSRDDAGNALLLAEAGLGKGQHGGKDGNLGVHDGGVEWG